MELSQGPIHYREAGSGEPIVFVHGVFVNGDLWRNVVPRLSDRFRCITPDWPLGSHPEPMLDHADLSTPGLARLVADFLDALGLDAVTLVVTTREGQSASWLSQIIANASAGSFSRRVTRSRSTPRNRSGSCERSRPSRGPRSCLPRVSVSERYGVSRSRTDG